MAGLTDDDDQESGPRCAATFEGYSCAYDLGHTGGHWTITEASEVSWTEEHIARRRAALENAKHRLEDLILALEETDDAQSASEVREALGNLLAIFGPGNVASLGDAPTSESRKG